MELKRAERRERELERRCGLRRERESLRSVLKESERKEKGWKRDKKG